MNLKLNKNEIERFSRQIILKDIGASGQKKIKKNQFKDKDFLLQNKT